MVRWSLSAEFIAFIIVAVLTLYFYDRKRVPTRQRKMYSLCLAMSFVSILLDAVCVFTVQNTRSVPIWVNIALNSLYFFMNVLMCSVMAAYLFILLLEHVYDKTCLRSALWVVGALCAAYTVCVALNIRSGILFSFDAAGGYVRGPLNALGYAVMAAELLLLAACFLKNRRSVGARMTRVMYTLPPIILLASVFQQLYPEILMNGMLFALADMILFISFQSRRIERDSLTGIGNRNSFYHELKLRLAGGQQFQIILLSLRRFAAVNQRCGHERGDAVLYEIAKYLDTSFADGRAFRFGSVEFALLVPFQSARGAQEMLARVSSRFDAPWELGDLRLNVGADFADIVRREEAWTPVEVIAFLEYALRLAKNDAGGVVHFDACAARSFERRTQLIDTIRRSIAQRRFTVWYQPIWCCRDGAFCAAEALLRLEDYDGNLVPPSEFIPLAEETGMIDELCWVVLDEICRFLASAQARKLSSVSINLSMQQFLNDDLAARVEASLKKYGVAAQRLKLEITERVALDDLRRVACVMKTLAQMGVRFYLDDFGTGYANFACVLNLDFECVKLDRSLAAGVPNDRRADTMARGVIQLFHDMGLQVVAEGVETAEQAEYLRRYGADRIQGFYYAKPMPEKELVAFLARHSQVDAGGAETAGAAAPARG